MEEGPLTVEAFSIVWWFLKDLVQGHAFFRLLDRTSGSSWLAVLAEITATENQSLKSTICLTMLLFQGSASFAMSKEW